jgi:3-phenylpropionate/cinnamic acid dioxygenase small subunit
VNDHQAIVELLYRYAELVDGGDYEGVARMFEHGAITAEGSDHADRGHDAVLARYVDWTRRHDDGTPRTKHVTTNPIVAIDGDTATVRSYFTVLQQTASVALQPIIAGRYEDRMKRAENGWRFVHRHMVPELFGDLSDHLNQPIRQDEGGS